jgi:hypothetical protein
VLLVQHDPGREPLGIEVAAAPVAAVEALRVEAVEAMDCVRHLLAPRLDDEVEVRAVS